MNKSLVQIFPNYSSIHREDWAYSHSSNTRWFALLLCSLSIAGITGNTLVCVAISVEKKLQNITNYFLLSLAFADLFVSLVVMPCGILQEIMGYWPLGLAMCNAWQVSDVIMCTSSIMHMTSISIDRYIGIHDPLKNRNKSRMTVLVKIAAVWFLSAAIGSPLIVLGVVRPEQILDEQKQCAIFNAYYLVYGSLAAFFGPLTIMLVAFTLTVRLLNRQARQLGIDAGSGIRRCKADKNRHQGINGRIEMRLMAPLGITQAIASRRTNPDELHVLAAFTGAKLNNSVEFQTRNNSSESSIDARSDENQTSSTYELTKVKTDTSTEGQMSSEKNRSIGVDGKLQNTLITQIKANEKRFNNTSQNTVNQNAVNNFDKAKETEKCYSETVCKRNRILESMKRLRDMKVYGAKENSLLCQIDNDAEFGIKGELKKSKRCSAAEINEAAINNDEQIPLLETNSNDLNKNEEDEVFTKIPTTSDDNPDEKCNQKSNLSHRANNIQNNHCSNEKTIRKQNIELCSRSGNTEVPENCQKFSGKNFSHLDERNDKESKQLNESRGSLKDLIQFSEVKDNVINNTCNCSALNREFNKTFNDSNTEVNPSRTACKCNDHGKFSSEGQVENTSVDEKKIKTNKYIDNVMNHLNKNPIESMGEDACTHKSVPNLICMLFNPYEKENSSSRPSVQIQTLLEEYIQLHLHQNCMQLRKCKSLNDFTSLSSSNTPEISNTYKGGEIGSASSQEKPNTTRRRLSKPSAILRKVRGQSETNSSSRTSVASVGSQQTDRAKGAGPGRLRFKSLVKKHGAAFQVAGMLLAKREDRRKTEVNTVKTEQKAIKVIGTMFIIFFICWAPFFTTNLTSGLCPNCRISSTLFKTFLWLGYVSSTLNPIIYTIFNQTFKETFLKLLRCECCVSRRNWSGGGRSYCREILLAAEAQTSNLVRRAPQGSSHRMKLSNRSSCPSTTNTLTGDPSCV